jgi:hypothetical protein
MLLVRVVVFVVGAALAVWSLSSAVRTMVVPRSLQSVLARAVFEGVRGVLRLLIGRNPSYERVDRVMAHYAPVSLMTLPVVCLAIVAVGFAAMFWSFGSHSVRTAFELSGSSLLTLGTHAAGDFPTEVLTYVEAGTGLGLVALLIAYLPSIYATFNRREVAVALLEVRADTPSAGTAGSPRCGRTGRRGSPTWRRATRRCPPWCSSGHPSPTAPG